EAVPDWTAAGSWQLHYSCGAAKGEVAITASAGRVKVKHRKASMGGSSPRLPTLGFRRRIATMGHEKRCPTLPGDEPCLIPRFSPPSPTSSPPTPPRYCS